MHEVCRVIHLARMQWSPQPKSHKYTIPIVLLFHVIWFSKLYVYTGVHDMCNAWLNRLFGTTCTRFPTLPHSYPHQQCVSASQTVCNMTSNILYHQCKCSYVCCEKWKWHWIFHATQTHPIHQTIDVSMVRPEAGRNITRTTVHRLHWRGSRLQIETTTSQLQTEDCSAVIALQWSPHKWVSEWKNQTIAEVLNPHVWLMLALPVGVRFVDHCEEKTIQPSPQK